jgi:hypothetical protein
MLTNVCYSFVDDKHVIHVASVHAYDAPRRRRFRNHRRFRRRCPTCAPTWKSVYTQGWAKQHLGRHARRTGLKRVCAGPFRPPDKRAQGSGPATRMMRACEAHG